MLARVYLPSFSGIVLFNCVGALISQLFSSASSAMLMAVMRSKNLFPFQADFIKLPPRKGGQDR